MNSPWVALSLSMGAQLGMVPADPAGFPAGLAEHMNEGFDRLLTI